MIVSRRALLALPPALAAGSWLGRADAADPADALAEITKARADLTSLRAPFEQTRLIGLLASEVKSRGKLAMVRPDRLRWELEPPDAVVYWIGPEGVSVRAGQGKATRAPNDARFGGLLADLLVFLGGDLQRLGDRYDLTATRRDGGAIQLVAVPRDAATKKLVARLEITTNAEKWGVGRVVVEEPGGDRSDVVFGANEKNPKIDAAEIAPPR